MTALQEKEREALVGDRLAVVRLVSAVREFREAAARLLADRYTDGEVDAVALRQFERDVAEIEQAHEEEDDDS